MLYLNTIEQLFLFIEQFDQLEVCLPYSRLLTGIPILVGFQNLRWNSNKTSLLWLLVSNRFESTISFLRIPPPTIQQMWMCETCPGPTQATCATLSWHVTAASWLLGLEGKVKWGYRPHPACSLNLGLFPVVPSTAQTWCVATQCSLLEFSRRKQEQAETSIGPFQFGLAPTLLESYTNYLLSSWMVFLQFRWLLN